MKTKPLKQPYLFSVGPDTPPALEVSAGEEFSLEIRGAFSDLEDVRKLPEPFTPEMQGHPLTPVSGPVFVRGAEPGDSVIVELLEITPKEGEGVTAVLRRWGCLRDDFREPQIFPCPVRNGSVWFRDIPLPLWPNLGTVSTIPAPPSDPSLGGAHGGDLDHRDVTTGARIHLSVELPGALVFFADPHATITDGLISGIGVECPVTLRARILLQKGKTLKNAIIELGETLQFVGTGLTTQAAFENAARCAVRYVAAETGLSDVEAYMLTSLAGEMRTWTTPRPIMSARLIIPKSILRSGRSKSKN